ncbi:hypothetical protein J6590_081599 [Homalodisca vitripennis]|nr:hypothetical protein J6590_081599 [Homalodisca vitripennis]
MEGTTMERIVTALFSVHPQRPLVDIERVESVSLFTIEDLLRSEMPEETILVELAQIKLNQIMMTDHGLSFTLSKTEIVVLTKKRINTVVPLRVEREVG